MMALAQREYESSICAKKICTDYKWVLNDWNLLYSSHYSKGIKSQKFLLNGTESVVCELTLARSAQSKTAVITIDFSHKPTFLIMIATISACKKDETELHTSTQSFNNSVIQTPFHLQLSWSFPAIYKILVNDTLILLVKFTVVKSIVVSSFPDDLYEDNFGGNFRENLKAIHVSKSFCDVTFVIGDEYLFAHKVILAAKSEVFKAMFMSGMKEEENSEIVITDVEAEVFGEFLNFIYVGKVNNLGDILDDLIIVADKYQVNDLKTLCENYMSAHINRENVVHYLLIAYKLCCDRLKKKALDEIKRNTHILANEVNYKLLADYPALIREVFDNQLVPE